MAVPRYVAGDHWVTDSITGFRIRSSEAVEQWDGNVVHRSYAEPRHPQDYVRARKEEIAVENARPPVPEVYIGPKQTTLSAAAAAGATTLPLASSAGFVAGHAISVMLSDSTTFRATVATVPDGTSITITSGLANSAASGALVTNFTAMTEATLP